eukprot:6200913-Pleurochrysis_carterae.AAC.1
MASGDELIFDAAALPACCKVPFECQGRFMHARMLRSVVPPWASQEIEKAWKMVDASHEKEARAKDTIMHLKTEISNLSRLVEQAWPTLRTSSFLNAADILQNCLYESCSPRQR